MPNIPGLNVGPSGGNGLLPGASPIIPRLGQGSPGGGAALQGLPGVAPISPSVPRVSVPGLPSPAVLTPGTVGMDAAGHEHTRDRLDKAMNILLQVKAGRLEVRKAQKMLDDLSPDERNMLTKSILKDHATNGGLPPTEELQALRALPTGKDPGASATMTVRPQGIGTTLLKEAMNSVIGMPAGIALAGVAAAKDIKDLPGDAIHGRPVGRHLTNDIAIPIAKSYAQTYGPLVHGDFSGIEKNPLGPVLDALSLVSAGLGTAGRAGEAANVIRAGRTVEVPGEGMLKMGDVALPKTTKGIKVQPMDEADRMNVLNEIRATPFKDPLAQQLAQQTVIDGVRGTTFVARDAKTGRLLGISRHLPSDDINDPSSYLSHIASTGEKKGTGAAMFKAIAQDALDKGKSTINLQSSHSAEGFYKRMGMQGVPVSHGGSGFFSGDVTKEPTFVTKVGPEDNQYSIHHKASNDSYFLKGPDGKIIRSNFPDKDTAAAVAKSHISPFDNPLQAFLRGGGDRGRLIDRYESMRDRPQRHLAEEKQIADEVAGVLGNDNLRLNRRSIRGVWGEMKADLAETRRQGKLKPAQIAAGSPQYLNSYGMSHGLGIAGTALREASDLTRAGAIFLRPAYLPNNWVGNGFMNMAHQGILAPVNLSKSLVMDKYIGRRYTAAIDKSMGHYAAEVVTNPTAHGYVSSATQPLARSMGMIADQPFRRAAWLHEARRAGYNNLDKVKTLMDRAAGGDDKALGDIAGIARKAQEEIVKFGHMNEQERSIIRNLVFVYSWVRGAGRYAARFPLQHPIQSLAYHHLSENVGQPYIQKQLGGDLPYYLAGAIPVGKDKDGNPILINPLSLNPLGTAVDIGRAVAGTLTELRHPKQFNKYTDSDWTSLFHPMIQAALSAREGGKPFLQQEERTIAPIRLAQELRHPGSGSVFPTSRTEALGHFTIGSMFPRVADAAALQRSMEREQRADPIGRIPLDLRVFKKATGQDIPQELVDAYTKDLQGVKDQKDFQNNYASSKGQQGFRNMAPANKADAAVKYLLQKGVITPSDAKGYQDTIKQAPNDDYLKQLQSQLWSLTGNGQYKLVWDEYMRMAHGLQLTKAKG
jgi:hypothetical protein